jgi:hypothetical protein
VIRELYLDAVALVSVVMEWALGSHLMEEETCEEMKEGRKDGRKGSLQEGRKKCMEEGRKK